MMYIKVNGGQVVDSCSLNELTILQQLVQKRIEYYQDIICKHPPTITGEKLQDIRSYREITGLSLIDSKHIIDSYYEGRK